MSQHRALMRDYQGANLYILGVIMSIFSLNMYILGVNTVQYVHFRC